MLKPQLPNNKCVAVESDSKTRVLLNLNCNFEFERISFKVWSAAQAEVGGGWRFHLRGYVTKIPKKCYENIKYNLTCTGFLLALRSTLLWMLMATFKKSEFMYKSSRPSEYAGQTEARYANAKALWDQKTTTLTTCIEARAAHATLEGTSKIWRFRKMMF